MYEERLEGYKLCFGLKDCLLVKNISIGIKVRFRNIYGISQLVSNDCLFQSICTATGPAKWGVDLVLEGGNFFWKKFCR